MPKIMLFLSALAVVASLPAQLPKAFLPSQAAAAQPQGTKGDLQTTLSKLDAASARFKSADAKFTRDNFNKFIGSHEQVSGITYFLHTAAGLQIGIRTEGKDGKVVEYKNGALRAMNKACYDVVPASNNKAKFDSFLTLGFGGSGKDLASTWDITDDGPEVIGGVKAEKLELVAKDAGVRKNYSKVILWMDLDRDVSVKQILYYPVGDSDTALYTDIKVNPGKIDMKPFEITGKACNGSK